RQVVMARSSHYKPITVETLDSIKRMAADLARRAPKSLRHCRYADLRLEITEVKSATAENGAGKASQDDFVFGFCIRVFAGDQLIAPGYFGHRLGSADLPRLHILLRSGLRHAY